MQAVILVGGEGTRLRPLTSTVPKPVVPLVDRPFLAYMLEWLRRHGVEDVVMSMGYLATAVRNVLGDGSAYGVRIRYVEEPDPRGTAGALKYAESLLDERFFMLNGDVLTDIDLTAQLAQHERTGRPRDARPRPRRRPVAYGLVRTSPTAPCASSSRSRRPTRSTRTSSAPAPTSSSAACSTSSSPTATCRSSARSGPRWSARASTPTGTSRPTGWTSARPSATCRAPSTSSRATSRPASSSGWATRTRRSAPTSKARGRVVPPAVVGRGSVIAEGAHVGSLVVLGDGVTGRRARDHRAVVVLQGAEVGAGCVLRDCIVGAGTRIGARTQINGGAVLGEGVTVGEDCLLSRGVRVFPHVEIPDGGIRF
jgi:mannose-1-phosphate guanylyltransferase